MTEPIKPIEKPWQFQPGNQFWTFRTKHGAKKLFSDPNVLWAECVKYFEWCQDNPLLEQKVFHTNGLITKADVTKMRAMTIKSLCYYLKMTYETWLQYRKNDDLSSVIHEAEQVIYDQKFTGAAADMLNPNIIARDLGLTDKVEHGGGVTVIYPPAINKPEGSGR